MLLGRPSLNSLGAIVSTPHLAFPSTSGHILTINGDQRAAREFYMASLKLPTPLPPMTNNIEKTTHQATTTLQAADLDPRINSESRIEPVGETKPLHLGQPDHYLQVGTTIQGKGEKLIKDTLRRNLDLFAWTTTYLQESTPKSSHTNSLCSKRPNQYPKRRGSWERRGDKLPNAR